MNGEHWNPLVIRDRLSQDRLQSYLADTGQDLDRALELYAWNMEVSGAVLTTAAMVEVVVRNRLDEQLVAWAEVRRTGRSWFDGVPLDAQGLDDIRKARTRATRSGRDQEVHGKVIAELSFGFWRYLVASRYLTSLWIPALHAAFPAGNTDLRRRRAAVEAAMQKVLYVRNRAAHHEPIHRRNLMDDATAADELLGWACKDSRLWLRAHSSLPLIVSRKP